MIFPTRTGMWHVELKVKTAFHVRFVAAVQVLPVFLELIVLFLKELPVLMPSTQSAEPLFQQNQGDTNGDTTLLVIFLTVQIKHIFRFLS